MRIAIVLGLIALVLIAAGPVSAQYTQLALSTEPLYWYCNLTDAGPGGLRTVYVLLINTTGTLGTRFRVTQSVDCTMIYLQDTPDALYTAGNVVDGLTVCFGECTTGTDLLIATIQYFGFGTSAMCSNINIEPVLGSTYVESVGCDGTLHSAYGWSIFVNDNGSTCPCFVASAPPAPETTAVLDNDNFCAAVATEQSTWGSIKALYK